MSADDVYEKELARLRRLLDAYGADQTRWPAGAARELAPRIAADPAARAAMAEARALDRALSAAPIVSAGRRAALADRILREVGASALPGASDNVVDLSARRTVRGAQTLPRRQSWQVAAAMAASLVLGVLVGATDMLGSSLDGIAALTGLSADGDTLTTALGQALQLPIDEEAL